MIHHAKKISIHTLLAESDGIGLVFLWWGVHFYPHSPCGERLNPTSQTNLSGYFYPHSPCGERLGLALHKRGRINFYPHSPCGERLCILIISICTALFLSTLSLRRATASNQQEQQARHISIHTLLAESDGIRHIRQTRSKNFYPHSPCGERLRGEHHANSQQEFLSTLSLRRATL
jgi:hypothetical protein